MEKCYEAFMLRLWQVGNNENLVWRASLESPSTGQCRGFATLDELYNYLKTRFSLLGSASDTRPEHVPTAGESERSRAAAELPTDQR
jgi:hypothetical protein